MTPIVDKRASDALNMFYGNYTIFKTMLGKWVSGAASGVYLYGDGLQVLYTALGYHHIREYPFLGPLPYDFLVVPSKTTTPQLKDKRWSGVLKEWLGINVVKLERVSLDEDTVTIMVDIDDQSSKAVVEKATKLALETITRGGWVLIIIKPGKKLPTRLSNLKNVGGSINTTLMPFMLSHIDIAIAHKFPKRILVYGEGIRPITTALSAVDHFNRHRGGKALYRQSAANIFIDQDIPELSRRVNSLEEILNSLGIDVFPSDPPIPLVEDRTAPYLTPFR